MDFLKLLEKQAKAYADKPAVVFRDQAISFIELEESCIKVASGLGLLGVKKSDKVAIFLPNMPQYIFTLLGVFLLRGVAVPLDFMLTEEELINFINHSESKILVTYDKKSIDFKNIKDKCPCLKTVIFLGVSRYGGLDKEGFLEEGALFNKENDVRKIAAEEKDPAAIFYTSGSTGHPKGVLLNYGHLKNPLDCFEYFIHPHDKDILLCAGIPFSHIGGLDHLLLSLYFGVTLILLERFQPFEFLKAIEKYRVTIFCIVPSMYVAVLSLKEFEAHNLSSLRYAVVFGAPSSPVLLARFHKACPDAYLLNGWGMTETAAPNSFLPTGTNAKEIPNTGKFQPNLEAKIVDEQGSTLGDEKEGELWLKGKAIMAGYYKEPELTSLVLDSGGWFKTGDIARRDKHGRYSIVGRKKEMIKVSGEIVFSPEVEEVIHRHPQVAEVAVIGVSDELRGEVPKAFIVLKEKEAVTEEDLRYFLRQHLAHFKIPHYFEFVKELPKNRVGKIDKEKLKARA